MGSLFHATRGPCKIEITTETGEKFSYNAIITQHDVSMGPSSAIHMMGRGIVEESLGSRNKEITLKFMEISKPKMKGLDAQLREVLDNTEEML